MGITGAGKNPAFAGYHPTTDYVGTSEMMGTMLPGTMLPGMSVFASIPPPPMEEQEVDGQAAPASMGGVEAGSVMLDGDIQKSQVPFTQRITKSLSQLGDAMGSVFKPASELGSGRPGSYSQLQEPVDESSSLTGPGVEMTTKATPFEFMESRVEGEGTPFDGTGSSLPVEGTGASLPVEGTGASLPLEGTGASLPVEGTGATLLVEGTGASIEGTGASERIQAPETYAEPAVVAGHMVQEMKFEADPEGAPSAEKKAAPSGPPAVGVMLRGYS